MYFLYAKATTKDYTNAMYSHIIRYLALSLILGIAFPTALEAKARITQKRNAIVLSTYRGVPAYPGATLQLSVPFHRQEHSLSCEAATLRMVLLSKGVDESESSIIGKMPFGPLASDPDQEFVGNIDGSQPTSGYGIHWNGLSKIAESYGESEAFSNQPLYFLLDRLHDGNPVIIWGSVFKQPKNISWVTPDGKYVRALNGEHVWVVTGYAGPRHAPTHIFTIDPLRGEQVFRTGEFLSIWDDYYNSGMFMKDINANDMI